MMKRGGDDGKVIYFSAFVIFLQKNQKMLINSSAMIGFIDEALENKIQKTKITQLFCSNF